MKQTRENEYLINVCIDADGIVNTKGARYNGGWAKRVTGLDKSQQNGYSIKGEWCDKGIDYIVFEGHLYLDCDIQGSRKNQVKNYTLFTIKKGEVEIIQRIDNARGKHWAIDMWENIEKFLYCEKNPEKRNPLEKFTDEQLIAELQHRGHDVKLDEAVFPAEARTEKSRFAALEMK